MRTLRNRVRFPHFLLVMLCICGGDVAAGPTAHHGLSARENTLSDLEALQTILTAISTKLDDLERRAAAAGAAPNLSATIDGRNPLVFSARDLRSIQTELGQLRLGDVRTGPPGGPGRMISNLDHFLAVAHTRFDELDREPANAELVEEIEAVFDALLRRRGLRPIVSAVLRTGFSFGDMTNEDGFDTAQSSAGTGVAKNVVSSVMWETAHWDIGRRWRAFRLDIGLRGQVGAMPVPVVYMGRSETEPARVVRVVRQEPAFIYDGYLEMHFVRAKVSEFGIFGGGGQTRPWTVDSGKIEHPDASDSAAVRNGVAERQSAYFLDVGLEYRMYSINADVAHHDRSLLSPVVNLAGGYRRSQRFGMSKNGKHVAVDRYFLRFGVDLRQVLRPRKVETEEQEVFGFRVSAEREWGSGAPDINRVLLEADVSLASLFPGLPE